MLSFCVALATFLFPSPDTAGTLVTSEALAPFTIICDHEYNCWRFDDGDKHCIVFLDGNGGSTDNGACGDKVGN